MKVVVLVVMPLTTQVVVVLVATQVRAVTHKDYQEQAVAAPQVVVTTQVHMVVVQAVELVSTVVAKRLRDGGMAAVDKYSVPVLVMVAVAQEAQVVLEAGQVRTQQIAQVKVETLTVTVVSMVAVVAAQVLAGLMLVVAVAKELFVLFGEQAALSLLLIPQWLPL